MSSIKVVIEVSQQVQSVLSDVIQSYGLGPPPPEGYSDIYFTELFETLVMEKAMDMATLPARENAEQESAAVALGTVLDPDISVGFTLTELPSIGYIPKVGLAERFEHLARLHTYDQWVKQVKDMESDNEMWQEAIITVYGSIQGSDRKEWTTWLLIERAYRLIKSRVG